MDRVVVAFELGDSLTVLADRPISQ